MTRLAAQLACQDEHSVMPPCRRNAVERQGEQGCLVHSVAKDFLESKGPLEHQVVVSQEAAHQRSLGGPEVAWAVGVAEERSPGHQMPDPTVLMFIQDIATFNVQNIPVDG